MKESYLRGSENVYIKISGIDEDSIIAVAVVYLLHCYKIILIYFTASISADSYQ